MKNYTEIDNELLFLIEESDEDATESLINKYSNLINIIIKKYKNIISNIGLEEKDLYQEGLLGLLEAINRYDKEKNIQFNSFATTCIDNRIKSLIRTSTRFKHQHLNTSLSLDNTYDNNTTLYDISSNQETSLEDKIILKEQLKQLTNKITTLLTPFEYKVLEMKTKGFKNEEIGEILNKDKRSIENAISRIRKKLKDIKKHL